MSVHFQREVDQLKQRLLSLSAVVERQLHAATRALHERDAPAAEKVIEGDGEIDRMEVAIEEECLKILALYQPVASDLRFIVSVLKINNDLERIGDLCVNVARKAAALARRSGFVFPCDLQAMSDRVVQMVEQSLDALVRLDVDRARSVCAMDESVNEMKRETRRAVVAVIERSPELADLLLRLLGASRNLERIADLATNIAEDVIYLVEGQIMRHQGETRDQDDVDER